MRYCSCVEGQIYICIYACIYMYIYVYTYMVVSCATTAELGDRLKSQLNYCP